MTGGNCTLVAWDTTRHPGFWKTATVHRAGIEPACAAYRAAALPLCYRWIRDAVPAWSRRLESNQPNVLYPKQAAHLAPPPREYPGVELNHASDVRSIGSDPSAGAFPGAARRSRTASPHYKCGALTGELRAAGGGGSSTGRGSNPRSALCRRVPCHLATGAQFRCEDSNLDSWCQRPASCHWTTPEHLRRAVTRGRTEPSRIPGERAAPRSP